MVKHIIYLIFIEENMEIHLGCTTEPILASMMTLIHLPVRANIPRPIRNALCGHAYHH
jgi:hypothetical protein